MAKMHNDGAEIPQRVHFIGIGGAGMSSLARYMLRAGYDVRGSDCRENAEVEELRGMGAQIFSSQSAEHLADAQLVAYSSAIGSTNPELVEAIARGIAIKRGALLARITEAHQCGVAVCGTHGKGTTAGALVAMCQCAGLRTSYILGAPIKGQKQSSEYIEDAQLLVVEVDESDRTHEYQRPAFLLINNIEADHLNVYGGLTQIVESFAQLTVQCLSRHTKVLFQSDGVGAKDLLEKLPKHQNLYLASWEENGAPAGRSAWDFYAGNKRESDNGEYCFDLHAPSGDSMQLCPFLGGLSNAHNLFAAASLALLLGISQPDIAKAAAQYPGLVDRCSHARNAERQLSLVTDYASHPTCIKNDILWQKQYKQRVIAIFQPYRYSLCAHHWEAYINNLALADVVMLAPIDGGGESAIAGISSELLAARLRKRGVQAYACESMQNLEEELGRFVRANDCMLIFGGGPIFDVGRRVLRNI